MKNESKIKLAVGDTPISAKNCSSVSKPSTPDGEKLNVCAFVCCRV